MRVICDAAFSKSLESNPKSSICCFITDYPAAWLFYSISKSKDLRKVKKNLPKKWPRDPQLAVPGTCIVKFFILGLNFIYRKYSTNGY